MSTIRDCCKRQAESLIPKFARRNIEAFYCETAEDAKKLVLSMIPGGSGSCSSASASGFKRLSGNRPR